MSDKIILIPSYNEKLSLIKILRKIDKKNCIYIMDDCSTDGTSKKIKNKKKIKIFSNKKNIGYEKNLLLGFKKIINLNFKYIITFDADGEHDLKDIKKVEKYLDINSPDLLIGNRKKKNRFVEQIVSFFFYKIININDPLSGLKAYKIDKLKKIIHKIRADFFLVDIIKLFRSKNYTIRNININSKILDKRMPRVGNDFFASIKILRCIKLLF